MRLLLIDAHYFVYRSCFAITYLSNSRGEPTNAIFGFTKTLRLMVKHLQPELGAVVWDEGLPQKRVEVQPAYKETRKEMPTAMIPQIDFIQKLTPLLGFRNISLPNTEADDLMGCYAVAGCKQPQMEVVLATNDKDLFQLVGPCVKVYTTAQADLASPKDAFALLGEDQVTVNWDIPPLSRPWRNVSLTRISRKCGTKDRGSRASCRQTSCKSIVVLHQPERNGAVGPVNV